MRHGKAGMVAGVCAILLAWAQPGTAQETAREAMREAVTPTGITVMLERLAQEQQGWQEAADTPAGAKVAVPAKPLRLGSKGPEVAVLCQALQARGFAPCAPGQLVVDATLAGRIATAQRFYGLAADGLADSQLYNALSLSAAERAARIAALAREWEGIRARARELGADKYLVVNIPSFEVKAVAGDGVALTSKAIVGRPARPTPAGQMNVRALKFNPDWTPPATVLRQDIYPNLAKGGNWIRDHGLVLINAQGQQVDWEGMSADEIRQAGHRFVQPAGAAGALGMLKFETDSTEHIYLHDTNERPLFARAMRAQSSGCIRVERWRELAAWISGDTLAGVDRKVATRKTFFEPTPKLPVFVIYQMAELREGRVVFYPDIYQRGVDAKALVASR